MSSQSIDTTSRSINKAVDSRRRPLVNRARIHIEKHIWFVQPFPAADEINALYHDTWEVMQNLTGVYVSFNSACEHQVGFSNQRTGGISDTFGRWDHLYHAPEVISCMM